YEEAQKLMKQNFSAANIKKGSNDFQNSVLALKRDSFCFDIKPLPTNSPKADYSPAFSKNGLIFVSNRDVIRPLKLISKRDSSDFYDLYMTIKDDKGSFGPPEMLKRNSNSLYHEGPSVFTDNYHRLIVTKSNQQNNSNDQKQTLGMYFADWDSTNNSLKITDFFPFNSSQYSVGQPSISEDGQRLYFVSDMPGGYGGKDLYVSHLEKKPMEYTSQLGTNGKYCL
ncbi:MAG: hypothetical protein K2Q22_11025, partial [Cytophagales bacterium]|nr:hypothetical protein [Cytophagales bacterium]